MGKYCVYINDDLDNKLETYMKNNDYKTKSSAIRDCLHKVLFTSDYQDTLYEINQKLNRILYRQTLNKNIIEQLFVNLGFPENYDIEKDEMLKKVHEKNNRYRGRFD